MKTRVFAYQAHHEEAVNRIFASDKPSGSLPQVMTQRPFADVLAVQQGNETPQLVAFFAFSFQPYINPVGTILSPIIDLEVVFDTHNTDHTARRLFFHAILSYLFSLPQIDVVRLSGYDAPAVMDVLNQLEPNCFQYQRYAVADPQHGYLFRWVWTVTKSEYAMMGNNSSLGVDVDGKEKVKDPSSSAGVTASRRRDSVGKRYLRWLKLQLFGSRLR